MNLSKEEARYEQLLEDVITQSLLQLMEPEVTLHGRSCDQEILERSADAAKAKYKDISGRDVEVIVEGGLSKDSAGGVRLSAANGRITVDNTLDTRLALLEEKVSRNREGTDRSLTRFHRCCLKFAMSSLE